MKFMNSRWLAAISVSVVLLSVGCVVASAEAARYGGTLHVRLHASNVSLDPREWTPGSLSGATSQKLASLVYDRVVTLDDYGKFRPDLAMEWSHDALCRSWQFRLRPGVKFSDDSLLTSADVATALKATLPGTIEISASENSVVLRSARPIPDLLEQLASGNHFIFRVQMDSTLLGTGPFSVAESVPATRSEINPSAIKPAHIRFTANEGTWSGRPFLDSVEVTLGEPSLRQMMELQIGKAEVIEIAPDLVRKARQEGMRVWSSSPVTMVALRFDPAIAAPAEDPLREAVSLSLDRTTMANVLLQREAQPAAALLPQWLSGYAFLFEASFRLDRAKELRGGLPGSEVGVTQPLRLFLDTPGDLFKLMAERVAVNARQANLTVQLAPAMNPNSGPVSSGGMHLFAWHFESLSARAEMEGFAKQWQLLEGGDLPGTAVDLEQLYQLERRLIDERRVLPLVVLPEYVGLRSNVKNWNASGWGDWRLADVWLESEEVATPEATESPRRMNATTRHPGARP